MPCSLKPLELHVEAMAPHASVRLASGNQPGPSGRQDWAHSSRLDVPIPTPEPVNELMYAAKGAAGGTEHGSGEGKVILGYPREPLW